MNYENVEKSIATRVNHLLQTRVSRRTVVGGLVALPELALVACSPRPKVVALTSGDEFNTANYSREQLDFGDKIREDVVKVVTSEVNEQYLRPGISISASLPEYWLARYANTGNGMSSVREVVLVGGEQNTQPVRILNEYNNQRLIASTFDAGIDADPFIYLARLPIPVPGVTLSQITGGQRIPRDRIQDVIQHLFALPKSLQWSQTTYQAMEASATQSTPLYAESGYGKDPKTGKEYSVLGVEDGKAQLRVKYP